MTLEQLAAAADLSAPTISEMERGVVGYTWESLEDIAAALDCDPGDLLSRAPDEEEFTSLWRDLSDEDRRRTLGIIRVIRGDRE